MTTTKTIYRIEKKRSESEGWYTHSESYDSLREKQLQEHIIWLRKHTLHKYRLLKITRTEIIEEIK